MAAAISLSTPRFKFWTCHACLFFFPGPVPVELEALQLEVQDCKHPQELQVELRHSWSTGSHVP